MEIKEIRCEELYKDMLQSFERLQNTEIVNYIDEKGEVKTKSDTFVDDWSKEQKEDIIAHMSEVIKKGGSVIVAEEQGEILGFAIIEPTIFGNKSKYMELSYIHVSKPYRNRGLGGKIMDKVKDTARGKGTEKLYMGSHPSIESQKFYKKQGCELAKEINDEIYNRETLDIQIELKL